MVHRLNVISRYLDSFNVRTSGKKSLPEQDMSTEDPVKQTASVEALINRIIRSKLPQWKGKIFAVGGFVRDQLLGKGADDLDLVADNPKYGMDSAKVFAEELANVLDIKTEGNPHLLDDQFKIYGLVLARPKGPNGRERFIDLETGVDISGYVLEITPPRKEGEYDEKRRPKWVTYTDKEDDARRRDLTVNAIYKDITGKDLSLSDENLYDPVGGIEDLKQGKLAKPDHPRGSLATYFDDPLRILRLVRFEAKMPGFKVDPKTEKDAKYFMSSPEGIKTFRDKISKERVKDELIKILTLPSGKDARRGLELMHEYNLIGFVSPTFEKLMGVRHDNTYHTGETGWEHTLDVLEKTSPKIETRLAALFHDIGKVETFIPYEEYQSEEGEWRRPKKRRGIPEGVPTRTRHGFFGHAEKGAEEAEKIMKELKIGKDRIRAVKKMIQSHMGFSEAEKDTEKFYFRARRLIESLYDNLEDVLDLLKADASSKGEVDPNVKEMIEEIAEIKRKDVEKGLVSSKGSGGYSYWEPIKIQDLSESERKLVKGPAVGAIIEYAKIKAMKSKDMDPSIKNQISKEVHEIIQERSRLDKLISEYSKYRQKPQFYKSFGLSPRDKSKKLQ